MSEEDQLDERLLKRIEATEAVLADAKRLVVLGAMDWEEAMADLRLLAVNHVLRRQLDGLEGALLLARSRLGHLSISLVRLALDEMIWLKFLGTLSAEKATELLLALGVYDGLRSLLAQRDYIGDEAMKGLWYETSFLDAAQIRLDSSKTSLKALAKEFGWQRGLLPSAQWVASQADELDLYEYLHSATSVNGH